MATYQWDGYGQLVKAFQGLADPDPTPLLERWERVIDEDNKRGVLAGIDCFDQPMARVTYRPVGPRVKKPSPKQRNSVRSGRRGVFSGLGPALAGFNNNLSPAEYRQLGGPPLAPRGQYSRVITNLMTGHGHDGSGTWYAEGRWFDVVSVRGVPFLAAHFAGAYTGRGGRTRLPARDLRGVRARGMNEALDAVRDFGAELIGAL